MSDNASDLNLVLSLDPSKYPWDERELEAAKKIAFAFFHLGALVKDRVLQERICEHYYYAIPTVLTKVEPLLTDWRKGRHPYYLEKYLDLVRETFEKNKKSDMFYMPLPAAVERLNRLAKELSEPPKIERSRGGILAVFKRSP